MKLEFDSSHAVPIGKSPSWVDTKGVLVISLSVKWPSSVST